MLNPSAISRKIFNIIIDYFLLNISLIIFYNQIHQSSFEWITDRPYLNVLLIFNLLWMLAANLINLYKSQNETDAKVYQKLLIAYVIYLALVCFFIMSLNGIHSYVVSREYLFSSMTIFGVLLSMRRTVFNRSSWHFITNGPLKTAIIVGGGRAGTELYNRYQSNMLTGYTLLGMFDDEPSKIPNKDLYLGDTNACIDYVLEN